MLTRDLVQPWKVVTLLAGLGLLVAGSHYYQFQDWDIGISLIMGVMAYVFAPWSVRGVSEFLCKRGFKSHLRNAFLELDSKTSQCCFPIPDRHRPFLADIT